MLKFKITIQMDMEDDKRVMGVCHVKRSKGDVLDSSYKWRITKIGSDVTWKSGEVYHVKGRSLWYVLLKCLTTTFPKKYRKKRFIAG